MPPGLKLRLFCRPLYGDIIVHYKFTVRTSFSKVNSLLAWYGYATNLTDHLPHLNFKLFLEHQNKFILKFYFLWTFCSIHVYSGDDYHCFSKLPWVLLCRTITEYLISPVLIVPWISSNLVLKIALQWITTFISFSLWWRNSWRNYNEERFFYSVLEI